MLKSVNLRILTGHAGELRQLSSSTTAVQQSKIGILMLNMGGPATLDEVQPFLTRLFTDVDIMKLPFQSKLGPWIANRRSPKVRAKYAEIGGGSPILKWTQRQGELLVNQLNETCANYGSFKYYVAFRYASPLTEHTLQQIQQDGIQRLVVFSQYPQYSCSTTGSSLNRMAAFYLANPKAGEQIRFSFIDRWSTNVGLVGAFSDLIQRELQKFAPDERKRVVLLFSAHSLPLSVVDTGDTYPSEVGSTVLEVMRSLNFSNPYRLVYQSKVGPKRWLSPATDECIKGFAKNGHKHFLIVPISFVNEHIETLHELDIEYAKDLAKELNIPEIGRVPAPNDHPKFIQGMADLVREHLSQNLEASAVPAQLMLRCPFCEKQSCKDARRWLQAIHHQ